LKSSIEVLRFKAELMDELENIGRIADIVEKRRKDLRKHSEETDVYMDSITHNIENFYMGIEETFKRIALFTEEGVPEGPRWHISLIKSMARDIPEVRPPVIREETRVLLDEYRKFRHLVRNIYAFNIVPQKVLILSKDIRKTFYAFRKDISGFLKVMEKILA